MVWFCLFMLVNLFSVLSSFISVVIVVLNVWWWLKLLLIFWIVLCNWWCSVFWLVLSVVGLIIG